MIKLDDKAQAEVEELFEIIMSCLQTVNDGGGQYFRPVPLTKQQLGDNIYNARHWVFELQKILKNGTVIR